MMTVLIWFVLILMGIIVIGCVIGLILFAWEAIINIRKDAEMVMMYAGAALIAATIGTGLVFAVIALGRNLA